MDLHCDRANDCNVWTNRTNYARNNLSVLSATRRRDACDSCGEGILYRHILCKYRGTRVRKRERVRECVIQICLRKVCSFRKRDIRIDLNDARARCIAMPWLTVELTFVAHFTGIYRTVTAHFCSAKCRATITIADISIVTLLCAFA